MPRNTPPTPESGAKSAGDEKISTRSDEAGQLLVAGLDLHRKGALEQADALYQEALRIQISADALHLRGMVAHQLSRHADGESLVRSAIELEPGNFVFHSNLGETLRAQGRIDEAITAYQDALAIDPRFVDALGNLALALAGEGRFAEALPYAQRACAISTTDFEPFMVCGDLLRQLSKYQEALAAYDRVLRLRPDLLEAWVNGGLSLIVLNQNEQAREYFQRALALDARSPRAATGLGLALFQLHRLEEAQDSLELALRVAPDDPDALVALARVRRRQRRHQEAIELVQRALERDPAVQGAQVVMGNALKSLGRFPEAVSLLEEAARGNPNDPMPLCELAYLRDRLISCSELAERLETLLQRPDYGPMERARMHLAAGALRDEDGKQRAAFSHVQRGNRLIRSSFDFDVGAFSELVDALIETVDSTYLAERESFAVEGRTPIFIFGMPRSGTTLTEQVLSMHDAVFGAGEIGIDKTLRVREDELSAWLVNLDVTNAKELGVRYLESLCAHAGTHERVTDKMPGNFLHIGLLATLFPRASFVHCERDPRDTCLSIYMQHFASVQGHPYAYDLSELGRYYRAYLRLTRHWQEALGSRIHVARYEDMVENPEPSIRALVAHCGLEWDERCLQHTENSRPVSTLSAWQARQPIYRTSIGRWRKFEDELGELFAALGDDV